MTDSLLESGSQHLAEVILAILLPSFHVSLSNESLLSPRSRRFISADYAARIVSTEE